MEKAVKGTLPHTFAVYDEDKERKKAEKKELQYKDESTHRVLTLEEYNSMLEEKKNLESKIWSLNNQIETIKTENERNLRLIASKHDKEVADLEDQLEKASAISDNLLRINRERVNAARKIQPKKLGTGFRIRIMKEGWIDAGNREKDRCYITTIETPYKVDIPIEALDPEALVRDGFAGIFGILMETDHDQSIEDKAYSTYRYPYGDDHKEKGSYHDFNVVFRRSWQTGNKGYWELVCWHTKPFPNVLFGKMFPKGENFAAFANKLADEAQEALESVDFFGGGKEDGKE